MVKERIQFILDHFRTERSLVLVDTQLIYPALERQYRGGVTVFSLNDPKEILKALATLTDAVIIIDSWYMIYHDDIERKWFRDTLRSLSIKNNLLIL